MRVRLETTTATSEWFDWAEVSATDADLVLEAAGLSVVRRITQDINGPRDAAPHRPPRLSYSDELVAGEADPSRRRATVSRLL